MTTLHMETEVIYRLSRQLSQQSNVMSLQAGNLRRAEGKLSIAWQSPRADDYHSDLLRWLRVCEREIQRLENLATRVHLEVQEWEAKDREFSSVKSVVLGALSINSGALVALAGQYGYTEFRSGTNVRSTSSSFNWYVTHLNNIDNGLDLVDKFAEHHSLQDFGEKGRDINDWLYENGLVQNPRAGWVGRLYKMGKIAKNPAIMDWGIPIGLNVITGLIDGEDPLKAVSSAGINTAIKEGVKYIFPAFGTIMVVNSAIQLAGNLGAMYLESTGHSEDAYYLQNGLDAIDLGGYIDDISNGVADMVLPPWTDPPDFSAISERAGKFSNWCELV